VSLLLDTCLFILINQTFAFMAMGNVFLISVACDLGVFFFFFFFTNEWLRHKIFLRGEGFYCQLSYMFVGLSRRVNGITCYSI
jgi:hypothetical protein